MTPLSAADLVNVWEHGLRRSPPLRALLLLEAAGAGDDLEALKERTLGDRDALLLTLRAWTFGAEISAVSECPACGTMLELNFTVDDILVPPAAAGSAPLTVCAQEVEVTFRVPTAGDAVRLAEMPSVPDPDRLLLEWCLLCARRGEESVTVADLPDAVVEAVSARMEQADPQADIQLACGCVECGHQWSSPFDIVSFFWTEVDAGVRRILIEVHTLASAYGWRETDILNMSAGRRGLYMDMINREW